MALQYKHGNTTREDVVWRVGGNMWDSSFYIRWAYPVMYSVPILGHFFAFVPVALVEPRLHREPDLTVVQVPSVRSFPPSRCCAESRGMIPPLVRSDVLVMKSERDTGAFRLTKATQENYIRAFLTQASKKIMYF